MAGPELSCPPVLSLTLAAYSLPPLPSRAGKGYSVRDMYEVEVHDDADPPAVIATLSVSSNGTGFICQFSTAQNKVFCKMLEAPQPSWQTHSKMDSVPGRGFRLQRSAEGAWSVGPQGNKYIAALITASSRWRRSSHRRRHRRQECRHEKRNTRCTYRSATRHQAAARAANHSHLISVPGHHIPRRLTCTRTTTPAALLTRLPPFSLVRLASSALAPATSAHNFDCSSSRARSKRGAAQATYTMQGLTYSATVVKGGGAYFLSTDPAQYYSGNVSVVTVQPEGGARAVQAHERQHDQSKS